MGYEEVQAGDYIVAAGEVEAILAAFPVRFKSSMYLDLTFLARGDQGATFMCSYQHIFERTSGDSILAVGTAVKRIVSDAASASWDVTIEIDPGDPTGIRFKWTGLSSIYATSWNIFGQVVYVSQPDNQPV